MKDAKRDLRRILEPRDNGSAEFASPPSPGRILFDGTQRPVQAKANRRRDLQGHPNASGVDDVKVADRAIELHMRMAANKHIGIRFTDNRN